MLTLLSIACAKSIKAFSTLMLAFALVSKNGITCSRAIWKIKHIIDFRAHPAISHCSHLLLKMYSGYKYKTLAKALKCSLGGSEITYRSTSLSQSPREWRKYFELSEV